ncbi:asparaginase [Halomicroarcula sp. GCM10025709]|uniref:asparaginase n=1 Tax=Haloarcula TaxID=2237 RepID=UPI0024C424CF|nr:asparaginase [Halomicroarcula sp. YJ-61-S]
MTIVVISTGGTIASTEDAGGDASPELTGEDLVASVPGFDDQLSLRTEDFSNVPSAHFTVEQMHELSQLIAEYDSDDVVDGIVVTQGTDVLEESAYFVDRSYDGETPVVFTGAMRNPSLASPDGPANLLTAVRTAQSEGARGRGALVAFNDRIHAAKYVTKTNSMNLDTFRSPEFGPLATRDEETIRWSVATERTESVDIDPAALTNEVVGITVTADMHPSQIPAPDECAAVVLAATGAGHIPPKLIEPLEALAEADIPLVATTRCPEGRLATDTYDFPGSEVTLQRLGCYYSERNLQKARVETIVGLAGGGVGSVLSRP